MSSLPPEYTNNPSLRAELILISAQLLASRPNLLELNGPDRQEILDFIVATAEELLSTIDSHLQIMKSNAKPF